MLDQHPRLLECVRHVYEEDGDEHHLSQFIPLGYASALLFLMGSSATKGGKESPYRTAVEPNEKLLDWGRWDEAQKFIVLIAAKSKEVEGYRDAWTAMIESNHTSTAERAALLATAWNLFIEDEAITQEALTLEYDTNQDGFQVLSYMPSVSGIDLGDPKDADEEELPLGGKTSDPTAEEIKARKAKVAKDKKPPMPVLQPAKAGKEWAPGDVAWVADPDGEHYLAEVISKPWAVEKTGRMLVDVRSASGDDWEINLKDLFLVKPSLNKPAPAKSDKVSSRPDTKKPGAAWKIGEVAWVRESNGEDWQGKIIELSSGGAKLKVMTGFQGAGNIEMVWFKSLSKKQPIAA
jgi:hypothetical protein